MKEWDGEELVAFVINELKPEDARRNKGSNFEPLVTTDVVERVFWDDAWHTLRKDAALKYGGLYVRASTHEQMTRRTNRRADTDILDGLTVPDQLRRGIAYYVQQGQAFKIYTDHGLSGSMPPFDQEQIKGMVFARAQKYERAIRAVFQSSYGKQYEAQREKVNIYIAEAYKQIIMQADYDGSLASRDFPRNLKNDFGFDLDEPRAQTRQRVNYYRPGITVLLNDIDKDFVHTLAATETNRLSRNSALTVMLMRKLHGRKIKYQGLVEHDDWLDDLEQRGESELIAQVMMWIAERKLYEVCMNSIRGQVALLQSKRPTSRIPFWTRRDEDGRMRLRNRRVPLEGQDAGPATQPHPEDAYCKESPYTACEVMLTIIDLYERHVNKETAEGMGHVGNLLEGEGILSPTGKRWTAESLKFFLTNVSLVGVYNAFGINWEGFCDPLVMHERFATLQETIMHRRAHRKGRVVSKNDYEGYLLTGWLSCACGKPMMPHTEAGVKVLRCVRRGKGHHANTEDLHHPVLSLEDAEYFFNKLLREHNALLIDMMQDSTEEAYLEGNIGTLEGEVKALKTDLAQKRVALRVKARERILEDQQTFEGAADEPSTDQITQQINVWVVPIERKIEEKQALLSDFRYRRQHNSRSRLADLADRLERYRGLRKRERNEILKRLFKPMTIEKDGNRYVIRVRNQQHENDALPDIVLRRRPANRGYAYRMPSVSDYWADAARGI